MEKTLLDKNGPKYNVEIMGRAKYRYTWAASGQNQVHFKIKSKAYPTSPAIGPEHVVPVFGRYKVQVYPSLSTLLSFQLFVFPFVANQRPFIVPPYAPHTNANVRGDPLHPPLPTPCHTSNTRICLPTIAEIRHTDTKCTMAKDGSASAAPNGEVASINPINTMQELRAATAKREDTCIAGVAWCEMWRAESGGGLPVRRYSYRGHKVDLWTIADWLKND